MDPETTEAPTDFTGDADSFFDSFDLGDSEPSAQPQEAAAPEPEPAPAEAAPAPETPPPAPEQAPEDPYRVVDRLSQLMEQERQLHAQRRQLEEERARLEPLRRYEELQRRLEEEDAEGALQELGLDLNALNRAVVEGRGARPNSRLEKQFQERIQAIERATQEKLQRLEQFEQERTRQETFREIREHLTPERYPLAAAVQELSTQAIIAKAQEHYSRDQRVPSYDQVMGEVETELSQLVSTLLSSDSVLAKLGLQRRSEAQPKTPSPTLSNGHAATVVRRKQTVDPAEALPEDRDEAIDYILSLNL